MTPPTPTRTKHDQLFRKALENPIVAQEFLAAHLPPNIKTMVDLSSLKMEKESFIEDSLKASVSDVLFSGQFSGSKGYIYLLLEHQIKPDRFMALRILRYMLNIITRHMEQNVDDKHLPIVYPAVFYNGKQKYTAPLNLWELFQDSKLAKEIWTNDYKLINVHEIPDEEFKTRTWSGIMEFFLKNIHHRNLLQKLDSIAEIFPEITKLTIGLDYLELMLTYSLTAIDKNDKIKLKQVLTRHLNEESGEKLMTSLAHHWQQEGLEKGKMMGIAEGKVQGIAEGKMQGIEIGEAKKAEETAISMLKLNLDVNIISQCTKLPVQKIQTLKY